MHQQFAHLGVLPPCLTFCLLPLLRPRAGNSQLLLSQGCQCGRACLADIPASSHCLSTAGRVIAHSMLLSLLQLACQCFLGHALHSLAELEGEYRFVLRSADGCAPHPAADQLGRSRATPLHLVPPPAFCTVWLQTCAVSHSTSALAYHALTYGPSTVALPSSLAWLSSHVASPLRSPL